MKNKRKSSVSIIGGADGPTSIFIAGKSDKRPLKVRIKNVIYKCKRKRVEKRIVAGSHTLNEVVEYAMSRTLSPMMVAEYKLQLPDKAVLQKKLQELINMPLIEE